MSKFYFVIFYIGIIKVSSHAPGGIVEAEFFKAELKINNRNCSNCPPGWGLMKLCTATTPTECQKCVSGVTYSSQYSDTSGCRPCSRCGIGLYEAHSCLPDRDTVCDDCLNFIYKPQIKKNRNFHVKCGYLFV